MGKPSIATLIAISLSICLYESGASKPKVEPSLVQALKVKGSANVLISFQDGIEPVLQALKGREFTNRDTRLNTIASELKEHATRSQSAVQSFLSSTNLKHESKVKSFWITNQMYIEGASVELVNSLAALPNVFNIKEDDIIPFVPQTTAPVVGSSHLLVEPGIERIRAPEAWAMVGGNNGTGAIVGVIETGTRGTHEALSSNYLGDYGWFDPYGAYESPKDLQGQGTSTTGVIVGQGGIGVAPGAKWSSCRGCSETFCTETALTACGQFMACPTLSDGTKEDCTKAPHVVDNGWGGGLGPPGFFGNIIRVWTLGGIIPVWVNGAGGPTCGTAYENHPGIISVGITNINDSLNERSARGPWSGGEIKPDVVAPGNEVRTASHTSDTGYVHWSQSSVSAAHTAGVIALLKAHNPDLSFQRVADLLFAGANTSLPPTGANCGDISDNVFPNNDYGYGRIDAYATMEYLISKS